MAREEQMRVRLSAEEKTRVADRAAAAAMKPATFMRDLALYGGMEVEGIPYETPQETLDKAKVRQAVENEESYEVRVEPGTDVPKATADELRAKAKALVVSKGLRYPVAYAQVVAEEAEAHA